MQPDTPKPAEAGFFSPDAFAEASFEAPAASLVERAEAAIERWYAEHFHKAALAGVSAISADDKSALVAHVTAAVATHPEE